MNIAKSIIEQEKNHTFSKVEISQTTLKYQMSAIEVTAWYMNDEGSAGFGVQHAKFPYSEQGSTSYVTKDVAEMYARQFIQDVMGVPFELIETSVTNART